MPLERVELLIDPLRISRGETVTPYGLWSLKMAYNSKCDTANAGNPHPFDVRANRRPNQP